MIYHNDRKDRKKITEMSEAEIDEAEATSKRCGLSVEEARDPRSAASSSGLTRLWDTERFARGKAEQLMQELNAEEEKRFARDEGLFGTSRAKANRAVRQQMRPMEADLASGKMPMWRYISQLERDEEFTMDPERRAECIEFLLAGVDKVLRKEMAHAAEVAQASSLPGSRQDACATTAEEIWRDLKAQRRAPRWERASWAVGFGFSSYPKFFRAALLRYQMTPHQMEIALLDKILEEADEIEKREKTPPPEQASSPENAAASSESESKPVDPASGG